MPLKNTSYAYGNIAKTLHWLMALCIISLIAVGFYMVDLPNSPNKFKIYGLHKAIGISILTLAIFRLYWRWHTPPPPFSKNTSSWQRIAAHSTHWGLYVIMIIMPLSGWLMSSAANFPVSFFSLFTLPNLIAPNPEWVTPLKNIHKLSSLILCTLILLHLGAALLHHFILKDNTFKKML